MATLQQVLGAKNLIGVINAVKGGLAEDLLPAGMTKATRTVEADFGTYHKVEGERLSARLSAYGAPSRVIEVKGISELPMRLIHTINSHSFKPQVLMNLLELGSDLKQKMGQDEITRQTTAFGQIIANLRVSCCQSVLANGAIYFDANQEVLADSNNAALTIDFGVPAGNKSQLNMLGAGSIIDASWATAGTSIAKQLQNIQAAGRQLTGYQLTEAYYGKNVIDYILNNTQFGTYMAHNLTFGEAVVTRKLPPGFMGFNWHPMSELFLAKAYTNQGSTIGAEAIVDAWTATKVVFTPALSQEWFEMVEGTYPVPKSINQYEDATKAAEDIEEVAGRFAYAYITHDPPTVKEVSGDTFLPVLKVPKAVAIATVAF